MYTVKGYYDCKGVSIHTPVKVNEPGVAVLVTFLSENVKPLTSEEIVKPFKEKVSSINMGLEPDSEYAEFLMNEYRELFGYIDYSEGVNGGSQE